MNIQWRSSPNFWAGRTQPITTIVIHWMAGNLSAADKVFHSNVGTDAATSAHYGIEDETVYQWVKDEDTAWHARQANPYSIGIEHSAQPGRDASPATLETSAQLIATLCKKHNIPIDRAHIIPHSQVVQTSCPGTIPLDALIARARQLNGDISINITPALKPAPAPSQASGTLYLPAEATSWRIYPLNKSPIAGNEVGKLNPSLFGGLTYDILGNPQANVYTIQTRDFGRVNIYAGSDTGARVNASGQGITKGSGGGKTVYLPAVPSWRVYNIKGPYTIGHEVGYLAPAKYGGLAYAILSEPTTNIVVIQTQSFGQVAIYVGPDTGAKLA